MSNDADANLHGGSYSASLCSEDRPDSRLQDSGKLEAFACPHICAVWLLQLALQLNVHILVGSLFNKNGRVENVPHRIFSACAVAHLAPKFYQNPVKLKLQQCTSDQNVLLLIWPLSQFNRSCGSIRFTSRCVNSNAHLISMRCYPPGQAFV